MSVARSVQTVGLEEHRSMARTWPSVAEFGRISIISITITLESKACLRNIKKEKEASVWSLFTHRVVREAHNASKPTYPQNTSHPTTPTARSRETTGKGSSPWPAEPLWPACCCPVRGTLHLRGGGEGVEAAGAARG